MIEVAKSTKNSIEGMEEANQDLQHTIGNLRAFIENAGESDKNPKRNLGNIVNLMPRYALGMYTSDTVKEVLNTVSQELSVITEPPRVKPIC